jgi:hypothetical protein
MQIQTHICRQTMPAAHGTDSFSAQPILSTLGVIWRSTCAFSLLLSCIYASHAHATLATHTHIHHKHLSLSLTHTTNDLSKKQTKLTTVSGISNLTDSFGKASSCESTTSVRVCVYVPVIKLAKRLCSGRRLEGLKGATETHVEG